MRSIRQRKITPSVPALPAAASNIPEVVRLAAAGCQDPDQLKLQSVFLDMYSTAEQKVIIVYLVYSLPAVIGYDL